MELTSGTSLGPYVIISRIGAGGMGEVWKARDPRLDRSVAIKTSTSKFTERFEHEARAIAALNHPHICQVYDVGPNYLVMEFIEGTPLQGPMAVDQALRFAMQICDALEAAHSKKITHRDLKPANILVTASGVKRLDFGLAKMAAGEPQPDATQTMSLTEAGGVVGTPAYMSPEQARGETVDARSDLFSFGLVLYEMLSGRRAFARNSSIETMTAILRDEPPPLNAAPGIVAIVNRCLRKLPDERFRTMSEVRAAIELAAGERGVNHPSEQLPSIAVLPFANMSADKENEYFSDGLAEEILNLLSRIRGLKVIARTSSFAFRGKEQDITKIAEALKVQNILEGSVRRAGNRIRVTAQLIQASDGTHLWSERYDRDMTDVFAMQDEIGHAISEALQVRLAPRTRAPNVEAWEHCLKGTHYRARNSPDSVLKAKEHFEQAIAIDPNYAEAYGGLSLCYYVLALMGAGPVGEMRSLANLAADKALAIDPSDSDSHMVLGVMSGIFDYDWNRARTHHLKSIEGDNVSPRARFVYGVHYLVPKGQAGEAIEQSRIALQTDPVSMLFQHGMIWCLYAAGRHGAAIAAAHRALEIDPNSHLIWLALGFAQLAADLPAEAVSSFGRMRELAPWIPLGRGCTAAAFWKAGDYSSARDIAQEFGSTDVSGFGEAIYYAANGEADLMFAALERAYRRRDMNLPSLRSMPFFDRYHDDPRFRDLLRRMNLI
jgi:serine/threonine-protein kinase